MRIDRRRLRRGSVTTERPEIIDQDCIPNRAGASAEEEGQRKKRRDSMIRLISNGSVYSSQIEVVEKSINGKSAKNFPRFRAHDRSREEIIQATCPQDRNNVAHE